MAISVDWNTKIISVPKADTTYVSGSVGVNEIRSIDIDTFRLALKALEDDEESIVFDDTHEHAAPKSFGGVTLARIVELINGYTVTFEDGQYAVNVIGGNSNLAENTNVNQVSIRSFNSAGLVQVTSGSGVLPQDIIDISTQVNADSEALKKNEFLALKD